MAKDRVVPVKVILRLAKETDVDLDERSLLLGYLFGRAAHDDRRLLTDEDHLRAYTRSLLGRLP